MTGHATPLPAPLPFVATCTLALTFTLALWQLASYNVGSIRKSMQALQEVHVRHLGPIVEGHRMFEPEAFRKAFFHDCTRGDAATATRLWRGMLTNGHDKRNWKDKFLSSLFVQDATFRISHGYESIAHGPAGLLLANVLQLHGAQRHVLRLTAAIHLTPYPDLVDRVIDRQNAERERAWRVCLVPETGRGARMARDGK